MASSSDSGRKPEQEYASGIEAAQNFQSAMKGILSVSKAQILALEKKASKKRHK
jgi:hypothetical protein